MSVDEPGWDLHLTTAALRADRADVASYSQVLTGVLGDVLPPGTVDVEHRRSLADRVSGRPGRPVLVTVHGAEYELSLAPAAHGVRAEVRHLVRGVVLSRREVGLDEWLEVLAREVHVLAARDANARAALTRLLGP